MWCIVHCCTSISTCLLTVIRMICVLYVRFPDLGVRYCANKRGLLDAFANGRCLVILFSARFHEVTVASGDLFWVGAGEGHLVRVLIRARSMV